MATDNEVAAAGFRLPQGPDLVTYGDDAIRANAHAAYALKYNFETALASDTNIQMLAAGVYTVSSAAVASQLGLPLSAPGSLTVGVVSTAYNARNQLFHAHPASGAKSRIFVRNLLASKWSAWSEIGAPWYQQMIPLGSDLNDVVNPGYYGMSPDTATAKITNRPIDDGNAGVLEVFEHGAGRLQRYTSIRATNQSVWVRRGNAGSTWWAWTRIDPGGLDLSALGGGAPARREVLQQRLRARKGHTIGTSGRGAVALRFDDAAGDFATRVLPLLEERALPFTRVTTTDRVGQDAGGENDTWENIESYCLRAGGEVWNHGKTHGAADTTAAVDAEVSGALATLRERLPRLPIDCWSPPGGQTTGWTGYMPAETIEQLTASYAGQQIMAHHALASGYMPDTWYPTLDGVLTDGGIFYSSDIRDLPFVRTLINRAESFPSGVTLMFHSNNIGAAGYMTMSDFIAVLDYLVAERDAGRLMILTVSGLACADSESSHRRDVLRTHAGAAWSESVPYPQFRPGLPGSTRELTATVTGTAGATVTSVIGESRRTHRIPASGQLVLRHPVTIPLDATSLTVSITGGTTADAHLYPI